MNSSQSANDLLKKVRKIEIKTRGSLASDICGRVPFCVQRTWNGFQ